MSDTLESSEVVRHQNTQQQAAQILQDAMQPAPVEEETQPTAEVEVETEIAEEQPPEAIEALEETEQQEEETGKDISTLSELAEAIEVDNDFLYNIRVPMPDGQESVSLSVLKDAYQGKLETQTIAETQLETQQKAFEEEKERFGQQQAQMQQMPEELLNAEAEVRAIASQYQSFDWTELEKLDPGRAALEKQNLATKYSQAEAQVAQIKGTAQEQQRVEFEKMRITQEQQTLLEIPEWRNQVTRSKEETEISTLLLANKFTPQEIGATRDPRTLKLLREFTQLKAKFQDATKVKKTVMKTPKSLKPGAHKVSTSDLQRQEARYDAARKSKDPKVKVSAISDLIARR